MNKKEIVDKSGIPSSWIIKDTNDYTIILINNIQVVYN